MPRKKRRVQNWTPIDEVPAPPPVVIKPAEVKKTQLRVAAYCRVSTDRLEQESSIESQTSYYSSLIKSNISWTFAGIYKDVLSGTKSDRPGLQAMLEDCRGGKIDRILCKSISRLARDTLTTLQIVMELRNLGISIYFEKEDIDTSTYSSEILLSCYSAFAEMESQSIGENNKWAIRKRFEAGTYRIANLTYGYRYDSASVHDEHNFSTDVHNATTAREEKSTDEKSTDEKKIIIDPAQASVVRRIFLCALEGVSTYKIASMLNEEGIPGPRGKEWVKRNILMILHNEFYKGDVLFGKTYSEHFKRKRNHGQQKQFYYEEHHEALVSNEDWDRVQEILSKKKVKIPDTGLERKDLTGYVFCGKCGREMYVGNRDIMCWGTQTGKCDNGGISVRRLGWLLKGIPPKEPFTLIGHGKDSEPEITLLSSSIQHDMVLPNTTDDATHQADEPVEDTTHQADESVEEATDHVAEYENRRTQK